METFLVLGATFGFIGVALGAFGSHALRSKLTPDRVATFETGVRYQMWHALALFLIVIVDAWAPTSEGSSLFLLSDRGGAPLLFAAGWLFAGRDRPVLGQFVRARDDTQPSVGGGHPVRRSLFAAGLGVAAAGDRPEVRRPTSGPLPSAAARPR
jgi:uncharacterized membrane protein YgdD (TMEM256/DUF423 family)